MRKILLAMMLATQFLAPISTAMAADSTTFLRPCIVTSAQECISEITVTLANGSVVDGTLTKRVSEVPLSSNDAYLSKVSGVHDEWDFPGLTTQNGGSHVEFYIFHWPADAKHCDNAGNCSINQEELAIYARPSMLDGGRQPIIVSGKDAELICPTNIASCSIGSPPWNFGSDITFHIKLKMVKDFLPLYANGRTKNFTMHVESLGPATQVIINFSPMPLENVYFALADFFAIDHGLYVTDEPAMWIYTKNNVRTDPLKPCVITGGLSIVTNAFNQWSPTWNADLRSIEVQLRASHLRTDGTVNSGYLEIRIPVAMAKCLWGVDLKGEVNARLALTYTDGTPSELITINSKEKDGYYSVVSAGFHYSSPKLQIKLAQDEANSTPSPTPATTTESKLELKKITCSKGKLVKVLTGLNPKCPVGFKARQPK